MAYRHSDYTIVIATMQQPNRTISVLKLTMVVEIQALLQLDKHIIIVLTHLGGGDTSAFVSPWPPLLERSLRLPVAVPFLGKVREDSDRTAVITVVH